MVPGIQAVFGFQLIAVFNERFADLAVSLRDTHFASLCLVVIAVALIMTPAAYDRLAEPSVVSSHFLVLTTRMLTTAMAVFGCAIATQMYVVAMLVTDNPAIGALSSLGALALFGCLWFALPLRQARMRSDAQPRVK